MEEEINFDIMRYELDEDGYVLNVFFGCASGNCKGYTGEIPSGYDSLEEWAENACIRAYKIVDDNLVLDTNRQNELELKYEIEAEENAIATQKYVNNKLKVSNNVVTDELAVEKAGTSLITITDTGNYNIPELKVTSNIVDNFKVVSSNKNILGVETLTTTINGVEIKNNGDGTLTLNGTSTDEIDVNINGSDTNKEMLYLIKDNISYEISGLANNVSLFLYSFDGSDRTLVTNGGNHKFTLTNSFIITQTILHIPNGTAFNNTVIRPQIEIGNATSFVKHEETSAIGILVDYECIIYDLNSYEEKTIIMIDKEVTSNVKYYRYQHLSEMLAEIEVTEEEVKSTLVEINETVDGQDQKISEISQRVGELNSKISEVADITTSRESISGKVTLEGINESEPIYIKIHPTSENIAYVYPRNNLYPSNNLLTKARTLRFKNTETNEVTDYELPSDLLYYDVDVYDEFILDYEMQSCAVNKRVGLNQDGTTYELETPTIIEYEYPKITLTDGSYEVSLLGYTNAYMFVRLMATNIYTTQFTTKAELKSEIKQTADEIGLEVSQKVSNNEIFARMNMYIQGIADQAEIPDNISKSVIEFFANSFSWEADNSSMSPEGILTLRNKTTEPYQYTYNDALAVLNYIKGNLSLSNELLKLYDANNDGVVNILDAVAMLNVIKGNTESTKYANAEIIFNPLSPSEFITMTLGGTLQCRIGLNEIYNYTYRGMNMFLGTFADMNNQYGVSINGENGIVKITSEEASTETYIDAGKIDAYYVLSGSRGKKGRCLHGIDESHDYLCHWDGYNLQFYVEDTVVGSLSDERLKEDKKDIDENLVNAIDDLGFKQFKLKNKNGKISVGIIAQELIKVFKENNLDINDYDFINETQYDLNDETLYYIVNYEQFLLLHSKLLRNKIDKQQKAIDFLAEKLNCIEELENYLKGDK